MGVSFHLYIPLIAKVSRDRSYGLASIAGGAAVVNH